MERPARGTQNQLQQENAATEREMERDESGRSVDGNPDDFWTGPAPMPGGSIPVDRLPVQPGAPGEEVISPWDQNWDARKEGQEWLDQASAAAQEVRDQQSGDIPYIQSDNSPPISAIPEEDVPDLSFNDAALEVQATSSTPVDSGGLGVEDVTNPGTIEPERLDFTVEITGAGSGDDVSELRGDEFFAFTGEVPGTGDPAGGQTSSYAQDAVAPVAYLPTAETLLPFPSQHANLPGAGDIGRDGSSGPDSETMDPEALGIKMAGGGIGDFRSFADPAIDDPASLHSEDPTAEFLQPSSEQFPELPIVEIDADVMELESLDGDDDGFDGI